MDIIGIICIIYVVFQLIKESITPKLPSDHWANDDLILKDRLNGVSEKEILRNAKQKRYYIPNEVMRLYEDPHKGIENYDLYKEDIEEYGHIQTNKWKNQGKYNLNSLELEVLHLKIELELEGRCKGYSNEEYRELWRKAKPFLEANEYDFRDTEAVRHWKKVHEIEMRYRKQ